jgi:hypothetical protein
MGGGIIETGGTLICDGQDVIDELNTVFGDPKSARYQYAQQHNSFGSVPAGAGNYSALIQAYRDAKVTVSPGWVNYLTMLGTFDPTLGPQNISTIAQYRNSRLLAGKKMKTKVHDPANGGHVKVDADDIDSPCPMPPGPAKKD